MDMHHESRGDDGRLAFFSSAWRDGIGLSPLEAQALDALARSPHAPLTRAALVESLAAAGARCDLKLVDVLVCRLRRKLAEAGAGPTILAVPGQGYVLSEAMAA